MTTSLRRLRREIEEQGFTTRTTSKGHIAVERDGITVTVFAGTPSDWRSTRNSLARLRRAGFVAQSGHRTKRTPIERKED